MPDPNADPIASWMADRYGPARQPLESDLPGTVFDDTDPIAAWKREQDLSTPAPSHVGPVGRAIGGAMDWVTSPFDAVKKVADPVRDKLLESALEDQRPAMRALKGFGGSLVDMVGNASPLDVASFVDGGDIAHAAGAGARALTAGPQIAEGTEQAVQGVRDRNLKETVGGAAQAALGGALMFPDVKGALPRLIDEYDGQVLPPRRGENLPALASDRPFEQNDVVDGELVRPGLPPHVEGGPDVATNAPPPPPPAIGPGDGGPRTSFQTDRYGNTRASDDDALEAFLRHTDQIPGEGSQPLLGPQAGEQGKGVPLEEPTYPWEHDNSTITPADARSAMNLRGGDSLAELEAMFDAQSGRPEPANQSLALRDAGDRRMGPSLDAEAIQQPTDQPQSGDAVAARGGADEPASDAVARLLGLERPAADPGRPGAGLDAQRDPAQLPPPDAGGVVPNGSAGNGARRGGVRPAATPTGADAPNPDDPSGLSFIRRPLDENTARLTPDVRRELERVYDEMDSIGYSPRNFNDPGVRRGGDLDVSGGSAGAPVYNDIMGEAPLAPPRGGKLAMQTNGDRASVTDAIRRVLDTGDVHNNIAEGALRVAERRAAGDYSGLSRPMLSFRDSAPGDDMPDALSRAIDELSAQGGGDGAFDDRLAELERTLGMSSIEQVDNGPTATNGSGDSSASLEALSRDNGMRGRGEQFVVYDRAGNRRPLVGVDAVDYQARPGETYGVETRDGFRSLDDRGGRVPAQAAGPANLAPAEAPVDTLDTGEQQTRLPEAGAVRDRSVQTPQFEAPFSLASTADTSPRELQTALGLDEPAAPAPVPANVRSFLTKQLGYTHDDVNAMHPDEAHRIGRERVSNPVAAEPVGSTSSAPVPLPERSQLPGLRNFNELRRARGMQRGELAQKAALRRDARLGAPAEPGSDGTPVRTPQERLSAGETLTAKERQALNLPEETRPRERVSLREQGNSPRQLARRVERLNNWMKDPSPANFGQWAAEVSGQAERWNAKQLKGGSGESAPPPRDNMTGEYLASGVFPGSQIFANPKLLHHLWDFLTTNDEASRLIRGAVGGAIGGWTDDDNRLRGMAFGALAGLYGGPIARAVASDITLLAKGRVPKGLAAVYLPRGNRDLSLWERLVSPPARAIREHFEQVRPALGEWDRVRKTGKVDTKMPLFPERVPNTNPKTGKPLVTQSQFLKPETDYLTAQATAARAKGQTRLASYLESYAAELRGAMTKAETDIRDIAKVKPGKSNYAGNEVANQIYRSGLAFNVSSAVVNRLSQPLLAAPYTGLRNLWKAYAPLSESEKLLADIHRPIDAEEMKVAATRTLAKFDEIASSLMRFTDNQNRQGVAAAAHLAAQQAGASEPVAAKFGRDVAEKTQGLVGLGTSNPSWRGPVMKLFRPFTKFPILLTEWASDVATHPDPRVRWRTAAMIGGVMALSKATGIDMWDLLAGGARWGGSAIIRAAMDLYNHVTNQVTDHKVVAMPGSGFLDSDAGNLAYPVGIRKTVDTARRFYDYGTGPHKVRTPGGSLEPVSPAEDLMNYFGIKTTRQTGRQDMLNSAFEHEKAAANADSQESAQAKRDYLTAHDRGDWPAAVAALQKMGPNTRRSIIKTQDRDRFERLLHETPVKRRGALHDEYGQLEQELGLR